MISISNPERAGAQGWDIVGCPEDRLQPQLVSLRFNPLWQSHFISLLLERTVRLGETLVPMLSTPEKELPGPIWVQVQEVETQQATEADGVRVILKVIWSNTGPRETGWMDSLQRPQKQLKIKSQSA